MWLYKDGFLTSPFFPVGFKLKKSLYVKIIQNQKLDQLLRFSGKPMYGSGACFAKEIDNHWGELTVH